MLAVKKCSPPPLPQRERPADGGGDALGELNELARPAPTLADYHELISAQASDGIGGPQHLLQTGRKRNQQLIAGRVAK
jgi:hypothetical protein